jgi:predicted 3-demethylubiquinone-9 3-methyltransferase (glyoxalase superfamily)
LAAGALAGAISADTDGGGLSISGGVARRERQPPQSQKDLAMDKISTCLWFDGQAEEAAKFYTSIFGNSRIGNILRANEHLPGPKGSDVVLVEFELEGRRFQGLNGGAQFKFSEAISVVVDVGSQDELDTLWDKLLAGGGKPQACGWLKDKFGLSWQIVPRQLMQLMFDPKTAAPVTKAMLQMIKFDIAALQKAAAAG